MIDQSINPAFRGQQPATRIRTKLKFVKSTETGSMVGFVSQNPKTGEMRGVREDSQYPKKICIVDKALAPTILTNVLYDCVLIPMAERNGYVVIQAEPVQFKAKVVTTYRPNCAYIVDVCFGNKVVRYNPYDGRKDSIRSLAECKKVLEKRVDVKNLMQVVEDFVEAANDLLALMKSDGARPRK